MRIKKIIFLIFLVFSYISCNSPQRDLDLVEANVKLHLKNKDIENGIVTKINNIKAISFEKTVEENRQKADNIYLSKVFIQGTWKYTEGNRIFNFSDTIDCYLDKNKRIVELENIYDN